MRRTPIETTPIETTSIETTPIDPSHVFILDDIFNQKLSKVIRNPSADMDLTISTSTVVGQELKYFRREPTGSDGRYQRLHVRSCFRPLHLVSGLALPALPDNQMPITNSLEVKLSTGERPSGFEFICTYIHAGKRRSLVWALKKHLTKLGFLKLARFFEQFQNPEVCLVGQGVESEQNVLNCRQIVRYISS